MKRFRFPLAGLVKVREAKVDGARRELAASERGRQEEEEAIMKLEAAMERERGVARRQGALDPAALAAEDRHVAGLREQRAAARDRLGDWIGAVERDRRRLLEARQELRALERLRERRYLEFVQEVLREESAALDESGTTRYLRQRQAA
jgi:flagellar FliJ protein